MRLCHLFAAVVAASLGSTLPTASAGVQLGSTTTTKANKHALVTEAERESARGSSTARNARRSTAVSDHDPDEQVSPSTLRGRQHSARGEDGELARGNRVGGRNRRGGKDQQDRREARSPSVGTFESEEEDYDSSWDDGTMSIDISPGDRGSYSEDHIDGGGTSSSCEDYDTEEGLLEERTEDEEQTEEAAAASTLSDQDDDDDDDLSSSTEDHELGSHNESDTDDGQALGGRETGQHEHNDSTQQHQQQHTKQLRQRQQQQQQPLGHKDKDNAVDVCVVTWNLAEESPPAKDLEFLRHASRKSDIVAVGVQEIENLKPRRHEGGRTREWRRLLTRTLGRDFVRVGHHAMGAVQLTLFARREILDRVKVVKLTEVVCGVGNVLQNKGGIGAYVRVDKTTFLFIAAHLAAHQGKLEERNAGYSRITTTLDQEIPPAWVTHAARKRAKRARAAAAAAAAAAAKATGGEDGSEVDRHQQASAAPWLPGDRPLPPRGVFGDRVDRVFFFGDLNYRVDLSREDLELGVMACRRQQEAEGRGDGWFGGRICPGGAAYPGVRALDGLLDFDQLTRARSRGDAFGGFSEARITFEPTYKYDKRCQHFDTSHKMRPPAWTDRILFAPPGPLGVASVEYSSVPDSCHSDHRPVYGNFRVRLAE